MKVRTSLLIGFGIGYVLGAKAGRERYEQIRNAARMIADNPPVRQFLDEVKDLGDAGSAKAREAIGGRLRDASELLRERTG